MTVMAVAEVRAGQVWADGADRLTVQSVDGKMVEALVWREGDRRPGRSITIGISALLAVHFSLLHDEPAQGLCTRDHDA